MHVRVDKAPKGRLWRREPQRFADATGRIIVVGHCPPGASKWNKIEQRLFCRSSRNWRGRALADRIAVVRLRRGRATSSPAQPP